MCYKNSKLERNLLEVAFHSLDAWFQRYSAFFSMYTSCSFPFTSKPTAGITYCSSVISEFTNAFLISINLHLHLN